MIILGFSVRDTCSYECIDSFLKDIKDVGADPVIVIVGNMIDLVEERKVSTEEARSHFESLTPPRHYIETSAKTGKNVKSVFEYAV